MKSDKQTKSIHYAWVIFAVCFLSVFSALGFLSGPKGHYLSAITENLNIPRSLFSLGNSLRYIATSVLNLFFGKLVYKFGPRKLMAGGFCCLALYSFISAVAGDLWIFYFADILLGIGLVCASTSMVGVVVERWFTSRKGTIMGFILAANGLAGILSAQIFPRIIYGSPEGWRQAHVLAGSIIVVVGIIVVLFMRNTPADVHTTALGSCQYVKRKSRGRDWAGIGVSEALHRPYFYLCAACVFLTGMILQGVSGVGVAHMRDRGISVDLMANIGSIGSLFLLATKILAGVCYDRFGLRITMVVCNICAVIAIAMLALLTNNSGVTYLLIYKILIAIAFPLETVMLPLIAKECFGQHSYDFFIGIVNAVNIFGYAVGAPLMNLIYDVTGTYTGGMLVTSGLMVLVTIVMQFVISAAHRERVNVESMLKPLQTD